MKLCLLILLVVCSAQLNYGDEVTCGQIDPSSDLEVFNLIFKGKSADIRQSPWHVGIYSNNTGFFSGFEQICGGTIVHSNIVISVATCFYDMMNNKVHDSSSFLIGAGKNFRNFDADEAHGQIIRVKKIYTPDNFGPYQNNLAIIVLNEHLKFDSYIKPICLNLTEDESEVLPVTDKEKGFLVGWGSTSADDERSNSLLRAKFTTLSQLECKKTVGILFRSEVTEEKICIKGEEDETACQGDSGSGFYVKKNVQGKSVYYLLGAVNHGLGNYINYCTKDFITALTNIRYHQDFIKNVFKRENVPLSL